MSNGAIAWLIILLLLLGLLIWWSWRIWDNRNKALRYAVLNMEQEIGAGNRYQVPWVLLVGDNNADANKLCNAWQLKAIAAKGWYGQWWCNSEGGVLHVPTEVFLADDLRRASLSVWRRLLGALLKIRGKRPLDAVIWTVSADTLMSDEATLAHTIVLQRKFADLQQRLGLSLPIYLVLTGGDNIVGMDELVQALPGRLHELPLGWSSGYARETPYRSEWVEQAIESVERLVGQVTIEVAALRGELDEALYRLPRQFALLLPNLQSFCDPIFRNNALDEAPVLRGLYFTGSHSPSAVPNAPANADPAFFAGQLLRKRVFAEQGLAQPLKRILHLRGRRYRLVLTVCSAMLALWLVGMLYIWVKQREQAETFSSQTALLHSNMNTLKSQEGKEKKLMNDFWETVKKIPAWHFRTFAYPASAFSDSDEKVSRQFHNILWHNVFLPTQSMLNKRSKELLGIHVDDSEQENVSGRPEEWASYREANRIVAGALQLEEAGQRYNRLLTRGKGYMREIADLSQALYGVSINVDELPARLELNKMLVNFDHEHLAAFDFSKANTQISANFYMLLSRWFDQLYSSARLEQNARKLNTALSLLAQGERYSAEELEALSQEIDNLQLSLKIINSARSRSADTEPAPGFNNMLSQARQSALIDASRVEEAVSYGVAVRKRLLDNWAIPAKDREALIFTQPDGSFVPSADLQMLNKRINSLRSQPFFMRAGMQSSSTVPDRIGGDQLNRALTLFRSYQSFTQDAQAAVSSYQDGLDNIAQDAAAQSIWNTLHDNSFPGIARNDQPVELETSIQDLIKAFSGLGRSDLGLKLKAKMVDQALGELRHNETVLLQQEPYKIRGDSFGWWDGQRNAASMAFNVDPGAELQKYLEAQVRLVTPFATAVEKPTNWLVGQLESLSPADRLLAEKWQGTLVELRKHSANNPASTPSQLAKLIATINDSDMKTCQEKLAQVVLPASPDLFAQRAVQLFTLAQKQCDAWQAQTGDVLYAQLSSTFNQNLAGRFPFAASLGAADADPALVADFVRLMDSNAALHKRSNTAQQSFLEEMRAAQPLLSAMLDSEGIDVGITWRTHRQHEVGADQIIDWRLSVQNQASSYPLGTKNNLRWRPGQPITVELRWASGSPQNPVADVDQPHLQVNDKLAQWRYRDRWALLRWLRQQQISPLPRQNDATNSATELMLSVPVRQVVGQEQARVFLQVGLLSPKGKNQLPLTHFPVSAPVD